MKLTPLSSFHSRTLEEVCEALQTSRAGLTFAEAARRLSFYGPNILQKEKGESPLRILWGQVHNPLIYVLVVSAVIAMIVGKWTDGLVVAGVVVVNALIGFIQEYKAGKAIEALSQMIPRQATAIRDGKPILLSATDLVLGDVVAFNSGEQVPADLRVIHARGVEAEEAALTGESLPVSKTAEAVPESASLGDRRSMLYGGTLITRGAGQGIVVATGSQTELGRISEMLKSATKIETPLTRSIKNFGKWLTFVICGVAALLFAAALLRGFSWIDAKIAAITLAVAAIPEGLPAIITIALAIGVQRMARRKAIIRKLPAVETLGSTTIICSDKTGTLTRNEMTVQSIWTPAGKYRLTGVGYDPKGELFHGEERLGLPPEDLRQICIAASLCNDSSLDFVSQEGWKITGDPTEAALVVAAEKIGISAEKVRADFPRQDLIPFESDRQFMATLHSSDFPSIRSVYLKGAPEVVLARCSSTLCSSSLDAASVLQQVKELARQGMRILAVARKEVSNPILKIEEEEMGEGFRFLGLVGMIDPPRTEAVEAIARCKKAGITVKMITGDHQITATAIGREIGLLGKDEEGLSGLEIAAMSDGELRKRALDCNVFARVTPEQKLRLVKLLQDEQQIVAMTGDGVNDAPSLKQANIGTAMGITGTAVSKESADMVLADDNFASIAAAVEEGRRIYDNLVKSLVFVLPTNIGEALIILCAVLFFPLIQTSQGFEPLLPILPIQILWINLVATVALALPLAFEAMEPNLMDRPPRKANAPILNRFVLFRTVFVGLLMTLIAISCFFYEYSSELPIQGAHGAKISAQTAAVTTVILFQIFYLLNCRSLQDSIFKIGLFTNWKIYGGIALIFLLQMAFVYLPFMNRLFGSAPMDLEDWLKAGLFAALVLPVMSAEKWIRRVREKRK